MKSWKEARRLKAIQLLKQGWTQRRIAEAYGVTQGTVSHWKRSYEEEGESGLLIKPYPGKQARLDHTQREQLKAYLDQGAQVHGFIGDFWTQKRVSRLIKEKFRVELKPRSCGDLLKALKYSFKKAQLKSYQQDQEKVQQWKEGKIPEIKKS